MYSLLSIVSGMQPGLLIFVKQTLITVPSQICVRNASEMTQFLTDSDKQGISRNSNPCQKVVRNCLAIFHFVRFVSDLRQISSGSLFVVRIASELRQNRVRFEQNYVSNIELRV
jgi:hypothetical protein